VPQFDFATIERLLDYCTGPASALVLLLAVGWYIRKDRVTQDAQTQENFELLVTTFNAANERLHADHKEQCAALRADADRCEKRGEALMRNLFMALNKTAAG